ncbi:hypothetical protein Glove_290g76 [Diversispora epigaea]|uniref:SWIM-type domain-containing protein n=1 Tax=Diversispora epigaea TaxID=1348612 RepID=A0A397I295_9GLOM|nr:hypothetical protein Glove_290g76 [Diversispora epigaea]
MNNFKRKVGDVSSDSDTEKNAQTSRRKKSKGITHVITKGSSTKRNAVDNGEVGDVSSDSDTEKNAQTSRRKKSKGITHVITKGSSTKRNAVDNGEGSSTALGKRKVDDGEEDSSNFEERKKIAKNGKGGKGKAVENGENSLSKMSKKKRKTKRLREARFKQVCNKYTKKRIERAMTEYMYLIDHKEIDLTRREYLISGPTGSVYTIIISNTLSCSCPDFQKGFQCKHILFVFLKVLKVDSNSKLIYQKALLTTELKSIFSKSPRIILQPSKSFIDQLQDQIELIKKHKRKPIDGKCPICFEPMNKKEKLVWCKSRCGNNIHEKCFNLWKRRKPEATCVYCQTEWKDFTLPPPPPLNQIELIKKHKRKPIDGKCPICFEPMNKKEKLVWCKSRCGNNIHEKCFNLWKRRKPEATCVYCQTEWKDFTLPPPPPLTSTRIRAHI